jgi:hypothetical protein
VTNAAPIMCVPAIMELDLLPDMGRMTGRLPSAARITCSPAPMPGRRAAAIYSLIESAKLNRLNPQHYLADVLTRIADHPARRIAELLPWNWQPAGRSAPPTELAPSPSAYGRHRDFCSSPGGSPPGQPRRRTAMIASIHDKRRSLQGGTKAMAHK